MLNKLQSYTKLLKSSDLMGSHCSSFLSILTASPRDQACLLYMMSVIQNYNCVQKDFLGPRGGGGDTTEKNFFNFH